MMKVVAGGVEARGAVSGLGRLRSFNGRLIGAWRDDEAALLFVAELVANSPYGQDHLRVLRVLFDFGSQSVDV
jgi:hypothetical protein